VVGCITGSRGERKPVIRDDDDDDDNDDHHHHHINSMDEGPTSETTSRLAGKPTPLWNPKFHSVFTRSRHWNVY
jgi:hypothetical protein